MDQNSNVNQPTTTSNNDDTMAIVAYVTIIGFIIAIVTTNNGQRNELLRFHLRQSLGLFITGLAIGVVGIIPILGWIIGFVGSITILVFVIMGIINAANKKMQPVPLIGEKYQQWFANTF